MDEHSEIQASPVMPPPMPPGNPPAQIKVLGILHCVIAGLGLLMVVVGLITQGFNESIFEMQQRAGGFQEAQARISGRLMEVTRSITWLSYGISILLAALLVLAGIGLLRERRWGLSWSNRYAWCSIGLKVVLLLVSLLLVVPKMNQELSAFESQPAQLKMFADIMKVSMIAGLVLTPVLSCIYPVLVLVLLNRGNVRKSLI